MRCGCGDIIANDNVLLAGFVAFLVAATGLLVMVAIYDDGYVYKDGNMKVSYISGEDEGGAYVEITFTFADDLDRWNFGKYGGTGDDNPYTFKVYGDEDYAFRYTNENGDKFFYTLRVVDGVVEIEFRHVVAPVFV